MRVDESEICRREGGKEGGAKERTCPSTSGKAPRRICWTTGVMTMSACSFRAWVEGGREGRREGEGGIGGVCERSCWTTGVMTMSAWSFRAWRREGGREGWTE